MRRPGLAVVGVALALFVLPSAALAKGPIEATLEGPGLEVPIRFGGWDERGATLDPARAPIEPLTQAAGFFQGAWGGPLPSKPPAGDLGPKYVVSYVLPGPVDNVGRLEQDVYPYAKPHAVTYMAPGQHIWGTLRTRGGWFVGGSPHAPPLEDVLREAGLPREPRSTGREGSFPWTLAGGLAAAVAVLAVGTLAIVVARRRPHPAV